MVVNVENMQFSYDKAGSPLLDIPQWTLAEGEQVFLHGPSGSGKSTFLNVLAGILLPNQGGVDVLGQRINDLRSGKRDKWRAKHIGVVFQQFNLIPYLSAVDNIRLAAHFANTKNATGEAITLLTSLGIDDALSHRPASQLSIGQQQRVAIARALINRPELIIADEPTSALDAQNRDAFMSLLRDSAQQRGAALVFVSHDLSLSPHFHRVDALGDINRAGGSA